MKINNSRGFTLIEIMMVVSLLGIFFSIIYGFLNFNFRYLDRRSEEHDTYLQARIAMGRVKYLLQQYKELEIEIDEEYKAVRGKKVSDPYEANQLTDRLIYIGITDKNDYKYYYNYTDKDNGTGQLKSSDGTVVVEGVKNFNIAPGDDADTIAITIHVVKKYDPEDTGLILHSSIRTNRNILSP
ncbi:type II secretion system protein [Desulfolucanica intricata]|uniref:type II secretion system protein n=1 Tax=Desulfolucanica intricata TaxID=1285191 RepID=UPI000832C6C4|nr:prepilin-type N-terminal cleavage/methylation domain-containing protein [Desulfolucanica intricata]